MFERDYEGLLARHGLSPALPREMNRGDYESRCRAAIDLLWGGVGSKSISWIGIYDIAMPSQDSMLLTCREPKPACSPIGLHGMCGRCWKEARTVIVKDVATLGANYIACDAKDRSELVVPLINEDAWVTGVLDVDSYDVNAFDVDDAIGMGKVLAALGLTPAYVATMPPLYL